MEEAGGQLEVVMFPWLAFGHMLPFLDLSRRLAARGHTVAFVSTPRNLARLPPAPPHLSGRLRFVQLPLPRVDGLPEGAESTADVPPGEDGLLKMAMDGLAAPLAAFLADAVAAGRRRLAGLLDYEDTRLNTSSRVRKGLSLVWKASLAKWICRSLTIVTDSV
ncbi:hypothetical protein VPH35_086202 [Triticum aestivum]